MNAGTGMGMMGQFEMTQKTGDRAKTRLALMFVFVLRLANRPLWPCIRPQPVSTDPATFDSRE